MVIKKMVIKQYNMFDKALEIQPNHILAGHGKKLLES